MIHRDLKPLNWVLEQDTTGAIRGCRIIDLDDVCPDGSFGKPEGTPDYIAPEMLEGCDLYNNARLDHGSYVLTLPEKSARPYAGKPADMWACGVGLYYMLTGEELFGESSAGVEKVCGEGNYTQKFTVLGKIFRGRYDIDGFRKEYTRHIDARLQQYESKPHFDKGALRLLRGLLTVDPEKRLTASEAKCDPWLYPIARGSGIVMQGFATKAGSNGRNWQRRWLELSNDKIQYFDKAGAAKSKGEITLAGARLIPNKESQLQIHDQNGRLWKLDFDSKKKNIPYTRALLVDWTRKVYGIVSNTRNIAARSDSVMLDENYFTARNRRGAYTWDNRRRPEIYNQDLQHFVSPSYRSRSRYDHLRNVRP